MRFLSWRLPEPPDAKSTFQPVSGKEPQAILASHASVFHILPCPPPKRALACYANA